MDVLSENKELIVIVGGIILYILNIYEFKANVFTNIIITAFCLAFFDTFLKKILLFDEPDEYHLFIVNNVITILAINILFYVFKKTYEKINMTNLVNIAFSCFFYELIVFKLYNYNNLCNDKLRFMTKTILRLATIHIFTTFLNGENYDKLWFDYAIGQIVNYSFFNSVFTN